MANLVAIFQKSIVDEDLEKWKGSICDALDKNLRRTDDESVLACSVIGLLAIQKGFYFFKCQCTINFCISFSF